MSLNEGTVNSAGFTLVHNHGYDTREAVEAVRGYERGAVVEPEVEYVVECIMDGRFDALAHGAPPVDAIAIDTIR